MDIIVGKTGGFCYGVKKAVQGAIQEANKERKTINCLGEIVHNKQVIQKLNSLGVKCIETLEEAKDTVLIRAHGVPKEIYGKAKNMNIKVRDYTCPNVLRVHKIAKKFSKKGYFIFLLGIKFHPENIGTLSYCGKYYYIFEKEEELLKALEVFNQTNKKKLLLISQTTYSIEKFEKIEHMLQSKITEDTKLLVKNTICRATELRQKETEALSKKVDTMIIIGGKNSSNTQKLYEIAKKNCKSTVLVENAQELILKDEPQKIGIMAGASTPKESVEEVIEFLKRKFQ